MTRDDTTEEERRESGWRIALKVGLFLAVPSGVVVLAKMLLG